MEPYDFRCCGKYGSHFNCINLLLALNIVHIIYKIIAYMNKQTESNTPTHTHIPYVCTVGTQRASERKRESERASIELKILNWHLGDLSLKYAEIWWNTITEMLFSKFKRSNGILRQRLNQLSQHGPNSWFAHFCFSVVWGQLRLEYLIFHN